MEGSTLINKVYRKDLIPNIIMVLGATVNVFFDGILVGQRLGDAGLAAVNQCLPFYLVMCTVGGLIATGAMILSSVEAGENRMDQAKRFYSVGLFLSIMASIIVCGGTFVFAKPIAKLLSTPLTYSYVYSYLTVTALFGVFKVLQYNAVFYLRLEGKLKRSSFTMILMTVMNIVLDYMYLFVWNKGIGGAALASGIATATACILALIFLYTDHSNFALLPKLPKAKEVVSICVQGSQAAFNNITDALKIFLFNQIFKSIGIDSLVAIFAILSNLNEFSICIQNGVPQTGTAMISLLYGGREFQGIRALMKQELKSGVVLSAAFAILCIMTTDYIPALFGSSLSCTFAILMFAASIIPGTMNSIYANYYNTILRIYLANTSTILRGLVFPVGFLFALRGIPQYIWMAYPLAEFSTMLVMLLLTAFPREKRLCRFFLVDVEYEKGANIYSKIVQAETGDISDASQGVSDFCETFELSPKKSMCLSLAIEEILVIIAEKSLEFKGEMDMRVFKHDDDIILRIRSGGNYYNPFKQNKEEAGLDYLGVDMIEKMAQKIDYQSTLGINTLLVYI
ncbi:MAG: hypothetical protein KBS56_06615 [Clostridiales bacterium]|nr:hypothetical protein [Candidatus Crickella equi]